MKIKTNYLIGKDYFGIIFIPTIVFYKDGAEKVLSFSWLFFGIEINF